MKKTEKIVKMYEPTFEGFKKELEAAERFGNMSVRVTVETGMERWRKDYEKLVWMSELMLHQADRAELKGDEELQGTYFCLFHEIWDCAEENLTPEEYHDFCESHQAEIISPEILLEILRTLG